MKLFVTGATGKVGQSLLPALLADARFADAEIVALCNNRPLPETDRVTVVKGSIADPEVIEAALQGVTHVLHMAAVKESPDMAIDVSVKGIFVLLEAFRRLPDAARFVLIGGDCSVGHIFHDYPVPITEADPLRAYPGCYALTKVLEEVMLAQYGIQYGIDHCCLRAPWIMEKDDLKYALSFGADQFGGPAWSDFLGPDDLKTYAGGGYVPLMLDHTGQPLRRNFVHVDDLVQAILTGLIAPAARQQTFNIAMTAPVDYGALAARCAQKFGLRPVKVPTPFYSNWLDIAKARHLLGWSPEVGLDHLIDRAFQYDRGTDEPRKIWYPG